MKLLPFCLSSRSCKQFFVLTVPGLTTVRTKKRSRRLFTRIPSSKQASGVDGRGSWQFPSSNMSFIADGPGQPESEKHRMYNEYSISIVSDLSFEATLPRIKTDSGASFLKRENPSAAIFKMGCSTENLLAMRDRLIPERFQ